MKSLPILIGAPLCGALLALLPATRAAAASTLGGSVRITDTLSGSVANFFLGRKLEIACTYWSDNAGNSPNIPQWQVRIEVDGKAIATLPAPALKPNGLSFKTGFHDVIPDYLVSASWLPTHAGAHQARCVLDPGGKLKIVPNLYVEKIPPKPFVVDVAPLIEMPKSSGTNLGAAQTDSMPAGGAQGSRAAPTTTVAQGPAQLLALPRLMLTLGVSVLENCGKGQDVVLLRGRLTNTGSGFAQIPANLAFVTVEADAGLFPASTTAVNLAPGQTRPIAIALKPKSLPAKLAGAVLALDVWLDRDQHVKKDGASSHHLDLTVTFPANYCAAPGKVPGTPRVPVAPAPARRG